MIKALTVITVILGASACGAHSDTETLKPGDGITGTPSPKARPDDKSAVSPVAQQTADPDPCATDLDQGGDLGSGVAAKYGNLSACGYDDEAKTFTALATGFDVDKQTYSKQGAIGFYDCDDAGKTNEHAAHPFKCWTWVAGPCPGLLGPISGLEGVPSGDLSYVSGDKRALAYFDIASRSFTLLKGQAC